MARTEDEAQVRESIEHLAERVAAKTVEQVLTRFGIDTSDTIKAQEQFAALRRLAVMMEDPAYVEDMAFMRRLRTASESVKDISIKTIAKIAVTGIIGVLIIGTKDWWLTHISLK